MSFFANSRAQFERGTISYMLTATLTRPTTISPTTSCDAKVHLVDSIDIAPIPEPKPRVISLEPISRRSRARTPRKRPDTSATEGPPQSPNAPEFPRKTLPEPNGAHEDGDGLRSPSPSDVSFETSRSSGNASGTEYGIRSINTATDGMNSQNGTTRTTQKGKTITATIDVLKGGFLRGDQIPIKITVNHTKHVRSLKGIIITLYRLARVDMHPALPVVPNSKGDKNKTEDYYPKSRTGLGGLSLSSAGSSHTFRKDLSQSFAPLFVDPRTLTADVKCTVRVPDEAFPTISNVPGAMISFKYYIEVVVDIQGKLTGLDRMVANAGLVNVPSATGAGSEDPTGSMFSTWGGNFVDTDQIRREKGVISSLFEVVVGTKDSERNGKRKQTQIPEAHNDLYDSPMDNSNDSNGTEGYDQDYYGYDENGQYYDYGYDPAYYEVPGYEQHNNRAQASYNAPPQPPQTEQGLSEKEQLRRAEARLLPSQPPDMTGPSSSSGVAPYGIPPSAPVLPEDDEIAAPYFGAGSSSSASVPVHPPPPFRAASSPSMIPRTYTNPSMPPRATSTTNVETRTPDTDSSATVTAAPQQPSTSTVNGNGEVHSKPLPPLPPLPPQSPSSSAGPAPSYSAFSLPHVQPIDDKHEMQRRRLELERSAPPTDERDEEGESSHPHSQPSAPPVTAMQNLNLAPSAPVLDDDDQDLVDAMRAGRSTANAAQNSSTDNRRSEALPEYRR